MTKIILTTTFLLFNVTLLFSQNCNRFIDKHADDPFSKEAVFGQWLIYSSESITRSERLRFKSTDNKALYLEYLTSNNADIEQNHSIIITFENNATFTLEFTFSGERKIGTEFFYYCHQPLKNKDEMELFYQTPIKSIVNTKTKETTELSTTKSRFLMSSIQCITSEIGISDINYKDGCDNPQTHKPFENATLFFTVKNHSDKCKWEFESDTLKYTNLKDLSAAPTFLKGRIKIEQGKTYLMLKSEYNFGCIDKDSYITLLMGKKAMITYNTIIQTDEGELGILIEPHLDFYSKHPITKIRISFNANYLDIEVEENWIQDFLEDCLSY